MSRNDDLARREFIKGTGLVTMGLFAGSSVLSRPLNAEAGSSRVPNIVFIVTDDLGWGDLGCYGSQSISTPVLDGLAKEGVRMTEFFSSGPICSPSRAGMLTGRYPLRAGVPEVFLPTWGKLSFVLPFRLIRGDNLGLPTEEIILPQLLKEKGYSTCCIGKWHLGDMKKYRPHHRGLDHYFGLLYSNDMTPLPLYRNDEIVEKSPVNQDYLTQKYTKETLGFIDEHKDGLFFLYMAHTFPHRPVHASPAFQGRSGGGLYGDCVEEIDWSTGQILDRLEKHGLRDNTLVIFTSDNGPWFQGNPGYHRGRKHETFDGGMCVPMIASWPGKLPAGYVTHEMSMNMDIFATILAAAGASLPTDRIIDGKNILPMLQGKEPTPHEALYFYRHDQLQAVRVGKWKYQRRHWVMLMHLYESKGPWLFNLEDDPNESYDVSLRYPEKVAELEAMCVEWEKNFRPGV